MFVELPKMIGLRIAAVGVVVGVIIMGKVRP